MNINIKRCYFHSIQPLINFKNRRSRIEEIMVRLKTMFDFGYLVPGNEVLNILPKEYQNRPNIPFCGDDSVYLAQDKNTELPSIGGSYRNGTFSAYFEHISGRPSLVFDEHIVDNKKIEKRVHALSEEVCIQEKIPLKDVIAIALPYTTPLESVATYLKSWEFIQKYEDLILDIDIKIINDLLPEIENILINKNESIEKSYQIVQKFKDFLEKRNIDIPCIRYDGTEFNKEEDYTFITENEEKVKRLIKQTKSL